jgi:hypothetical protein
VVENTYRVGQRVYTADGHMGDFLTRIENGPFIIRPVFESAGYDGEPSDCYVEGLMEVTAVFANPPVARLDRQIAALNVEIAAKRAELAAVANEAREFERAHVDRHKRVAQHEQLALLDDYIAGKITHVVMMNSLGVEIKSFEEACVCADRYNRGTKLLTLFGDSKGDLAWHLNTYSDGSGSSQEVTLCQSIEEAQRKGQAQTDWIIGGCLNRMQADDKSERERGAYHLMSAVQQAQAHGFEVAPEVAKRDAELRIDAVRKEVDRASQELAARVAKLAAVESTIS